MHNLNYHHKSWVTRTSLPINWMTFCLSQLPTLGLFHSSNQGGFQGSPRVQASSCSWLLLPEHLQLRQATPWLLNSRLAVSNYRSAAFLVGNSNSTRTFPTQTTSSSHNPEFLTKKMLCCCAQLWPTLCDPMDCSPTGINVHGIFQARILEWVAIPFSRESSPPRDQTWVSYIAGRFFTVWATLPNSHSVHLHISCTFPSHHGAPPSFLTDTLPSSLAIPPGVLVSFTGTTEAASSRVLLLLSLEFTVSSLCDVSGVTTENVTHTALDFA